MRVERVAAMSMGVTESEGGVGKDGKPYEAYTQLTYAIVGEKDVRRCYPDNDKLRADIRTFASRWGAKILVTGDINAKGFFAVEAVESGMNHGNN